MPKPTLQNRKYFKSYLKRYRDRFTSGIQTCQVSDISAIFSSSAAGLSTTQSVKLLLIGGNDYDAPTTVDNVFTSNSLVYFPASAGDYVNLGINSFRYQLYFSSEDGGITFDGRTYGLNSTFNVGTKSLTVKALGGALVETQDGPTYSIGVSTTKVTEGNSVNFIVNTGNVSAGTTLYFTTTGPVSASDFEDNTLSGSFNIVGTGATTGIATITRTLSEDALFENEDFTLEIRTSSTSGSIVAESAVVTVENGVLKTYSVGVSTTTVNEGQSVIFTVNTENVSAGSTLYYSTSGTTSAGDFSDNSLTGSFTIVGTGATTGIATITRTIANDVVSDVNETFNFVVRTGSTSGTVVATSSTITVVNVAPTYSIGISTNTVTEGESVTFVVNTTNLGPGTTLYYSTSGTVSAADFSNNSLTGSFTIVGTGETTGIATITRTIVSDLLVENSETFNFVVRTGSTTGTSVVTSPTITVLNTPFTIDVGVSTTTVIESNVGLGTTVITFNIATTGLSDGTTLTGQIVGVQGSITFGNVIGDINSQSHQITINSNSATLSLSMNRDGKTEGIERFKLNILNNSGTVVASSSTVTIIDTSFVGSQETGKTFGPIRVNRDNGNVNQVSDWYTICGIASLPAGSSVALFIDTSGSMTLATVQASYNLLLSKLAERNISIITVTNPNEDWITPFLTELA